MTGLQASARLVVYGGRTLHEVSSASSSVLVVDDGGDFPDALERGASYGHTWVRIPTTKVSRMYTREVRAVFDGEHVQIDGVHEATVEIFHRRDPKFAAKHGLKGSPFECGGWYGQVPRDAISEVTVTEHDYPTPGRPQ